MSHHCQPPFFILSKSLVITVSHISSYTLQVYSSLSATVLLTLCKSSHHCQPVLHTLCKSSHHCQPPFFILSKSLVITVSHSFSYFCKYMEAYQRSADVVNIPWFYILLNITAYHTSKNVLRYVLHCMSYNMCDFVR
jgi:hypothetical protein